MNSRWSFPLTNSIKTEDIPKILDLCNESFEKIKYYDALPQLYYDGNLENQFAFKDAAGQIIAHCSYHPFFFPYLDENHFIKTYCIGNVCTKKEFQGLGIGSQMLKYIEEEAINRGVEFLFLFSIKQKIYLNNGYLPVGGVNISNLKYDEHNRKSITTFKSHEIKKDKKKYFVSAAIHLKEELKIQLWNFLVLHQLSSEPILSYTEFCLILKIQPFLVFYALEENEICCLFFMEKGGDFENCLHGFFYKNIHDVIYFIQELYSRFQIFPETIFFGNHDKWMKKNLRHNSHPCLFIKSLNESKVTTKELSEKFHKKNMFVNTLQGA